jgi:large conductance mechanosensitive channel
MLRDFRDFVLRGNVVDLAVAVVLGAAFGVVVTALTSSFITPLIAAVGGESDFSRLAFTVNGSKFAYGVFVNALVSFLILAAVVFFLIVRPLNSLMARMHSEAPVARVTQPCPECLSEIPTQARRCAFCTAEVGAAAG